MRHKWTSWSRSTFYFTKLLENTSKLLEKFWAVFCKSIEMNFENISKTNPSALSPKKEISVNKARFRVRNALSVQIKYYVLARYYVRVKYITFTWNQSRHSANNSWKKFGRNWETSRVEIAFWTYARPISWSVRTSNVSFQCVWIV